VINGWEVGELQHTHGARWKAGTVGWVAGNMILFSALSDPPTATLRKLATSPRLLLARHVLGWLAQSSIAISPLRGASLRVDSLAQSG
jgi:hypothetical protein